MGPHNFKFGESIFTHKLIKVLKFIDLTYESFIPQMRRLFPEKSSCYVALDSSCNAWLRFFVVVVWFSLNWALFQMHHLEKYLSFYKIGSSTLEEQIFEEG